MTDIEKELLLHADQVLQDYRLAYMSRQVSVIGRREVLSGKAKFGIFGDGKEVAQIAMSKVFQKGDFRSGYYRDQTLIFALGEISIQELFAQLYAHTDVQAEPSTAGRSMIGHYNTRSLNPDGSWKNLMEIYNSSADVSPTGSQMPRLVGLAYASRLYRELEELKQFSQFSNNGNEIAFGTIGNASTSEGMFWEAINAIGVLKVPAIITIYDDEYGISVHNQHQMVKGNLSELLKGFQRAPGTEEGYDLYTVRGWDFPALIDAYQQAASITRSAHTPAIIHIIELTQPLGHSTSGSHERYKSKQRLAWEEEFDCLKKLRAWIIEHGIAIDSQLEEIEANAHNEVEELRKNAWQAYLLPIQEETRQAADLVDQLAASSSHAAELGKISHHLVHNPNPLRRDIISATQEALTLVRAEPLVEKQALIARVERLEELNEERYSSHLYSQSPLSALKVNEVNPVYSDSSPLVYGFEVLNACFDAALEREPRLIAFGEDVGKLGDVNQGFRGLQEKFGQLRVSDTGIRETTIIGQAIGLAQRGLRPIAEIQYLDYLLYALQIMSDDLATLLWRTKGGQKAPLIVRTRGHRLEGIWHSGSLMAGMIHLIRGMHVLVPRNMTQAAGFYNSLLLSDEPAVVVEVLNGYRLRERLPDNIGEFTIPLGVPEVIREGTDITIATYGACCRIALQAAEKLSAVNIDAEVLDVQSLLPFDVNGLLLESLKKTSRILFVDEDVPGGTTAYMLQEVIEKQGGYFWLDSPPRTLPSKPHRPAYGSDGDYWSKPNSEAIFRVVYEMMHEADPGSYPMFFK
jgi:pyruvate/2-oxoglutarate/acetoin dehydrogenase E1 component/TPP-dependent pyruvate/acetoin dehydrogenase alpha subunit